MYMNGMMPGDQGAPGRGMRGGMPPIRPGMMPGTMMGAPIRAELSRPGLVDPDLVRRIREYLNDQISAARFYRELSEQATEPRIKESILHAMEDEQKHFRMLQDLHRNLTGQEYAATPTQTSFASLIDGLVQAARDEIEAFEGYRDEYLRTRDPRIQAIWFELMTDEIEHATKFNTALHIEHMMHMRMDHRNRNEME